MYLSILDFVSSYGPTPLNELTSRVSGDPEQVAQEINSLTSQGLLEVADQDGTALQNITAADAQSSSSLVQLSTKSIKMAFAR
jgi:predicted transcriptional regulator